MFILKQKSWLLLSKQFPYFFLSKDISFKLGPKGSLQKQQYLDNSSQ